MSYFLESPWLRGCCRKGPKEAGEFLCARCSKVDLASVDGQSNGHGSDVKTSVLRARGLACPEPSVRSFPVYALVCLAVVVFTLGCAVTPPPQSPAAPPAPASVDRLEERALLLLLADRRTYDPISISQALDGGPSLRRQAALAIARIGDVRGVPVLESLLGDGDPRVRRSAAFGLGLMAHTGEAGLVSLLGSVNDDDRQVGILAIEALARRGVSLEDVVGRLAEGAGAEVFPRLMPPLFLFDSPSVVRWGVEGLAEDDAELRARAAYALSRNPRPEAAEALRGLLADGDPWVRGWAARALGRVGQRGDLAKLRPLLEDPEPGPIIRALNAARQLIANGVEAPPPDWKPQLLELFTDPRPGVRLTAIETSAEWLLDEDLGAALALFAGSKVRRERELALIALAEGGDPRGAALVVRWSKDPDPAIRARVAEAAALYEAHEILAQLAADDDPGVRQATLDVRLAASLDTEALPLVIEALDDPDPAVRTTAMGWAADQPQVPFEALMLGLQRARGDREAEARRAAVRALVARATATPLERGAIVAELETLATDRELSVRRAAADGLAELDRDPPALGPAERKTVAVYRDVVTRTQRPRTVEMVTDRGSVTLQLNCPEAPMTCLNFLQLAGQGFYDGLAFHRVVPDFVVQAGDPRGDGFGGPGYSLRDELNELRYGPGVVGMALSGPDTGGSQFFITLSAQPHLDGGYTVFGRVIDGFEVLPRIIQGDSIVRMVATYPGTGTP